MLQHFIGNCTFSVHLIVDVGKSLYIETWLVEAVQASVTVLSIFYLHFVHLFLFSLEINCTKCEY